MDKVLPWSRKAIGVAVEAKPDGKLIGYARVSTDEQEMRLQLDALEKVGCWNIYREKGSAIRPGRKRKELELALIDLRPDDTFVVWRLDRLGRHVGETIKLMDRIRATGAGFMSITERIDMSTPVGRLMFHVIAAFAQFESDSTSQRTAAGIKAIQDRGLRYGATPKLSEAKAGKMLAELKAGATKAALARKYGITPASVGNYAKRAKLRRKR